MVTDYSRHVFKELEQANEKIEELNTRVIPQLKKEYDAKIYDIRAIRSEKDSEIASLKAKIEELESRPSDAENEIVRLKNMMNKNSHNSSKPPSSDEPWDRESKSANEYNTRESSQKHKGGQAGYKGKCLTSEYVQKLLQDYGSEIKQMGAFFLLHNKFTLYKSALIW